MIMREYVKENDEDQDNEVHEPSPPPSLGTMRTMLRVREKENDEEQYNEVHDEPPLPLSLRRNPWWKQTRIHLIAIFIVISITVPLLVYFCMYDTQNFPLERNDTCLAAQNYRVFCSNRNLSEISCKEINCCYDRRNYECFHYLPSRYGYTRDENTGTLHALREKSPYNVKIVPNIDVEVKLLNDQVLEVDLGTTTTSSNLGTYGNFEVRRINPPYALQIARLEGNRTVLTTNYGPLIAADDYIEWSVFLTGDYLIGMGELLLNRSTPITKVFYKNSNDSYSVPAFIAYDAQHKFFHGLEFGLDVGGVLELTVLPSRLIVVRCLFCNGLRFKLFYGGGTARKLREQMVEKVEVQPQWMFGIHKCRDDHISETLEEIIARYREKKLDEFSFVSDCINANLMYLTMESDDADLARLAVIVDKIQTSGLQFVLPLQPQIPIGDYQLYKSAVELNVLYKTHEGEVWTGVHLNRSTAYLDLTATNIEAWFKELAEHVSRFTNNKYDALLLSYNWPAEGSFGMPNASNAFPYYNSDLQDALSQTVPWNLTTATKGELHVQVHNAYATRFLDITQRVFGADVKVVTSSYDYAQSHPPYIQSLNLTWTSLRRLIVTNLNHGLFSGAPLSSPVCSTYDAILPYNEDVCIRWYWMAATLPLIHISNDGVVKADGMSLYAKEIGRNAMRLRRELEYYVHGVYITGQPIIRPMFYDFFADGVSFGLDEQYMIGDDLLTVQLPSRQTLARFYLPEIDDGWYEYFGGQFFNQSGWTSLSMVETDTLMFIKGATIVPTVQEDGIHLTLTITDMADQTKDVIGYIQYGNERLELKYSWSTNELRAFNAVQVQNTIGCSTPPSNIATKISTLRWYGQTKFEAKSLVNVIDVCAIADNVPLPVD